MENKPEKWSNLWVTPPDANMLRHGRLRTHRVAPATSGSARGDAIDAGDQGLRIGHGERRVAFVIIRIVDNKRSFSQSSVCEAPADPYNGTMYHVDHRSIGRDR